MKGDTIDVNGGTHRATNFTNVRGHLGRQVPSLLLRMNDNNTALHLACGHGFQEIVKLLLERPHINVNSVNQREETPLILAVQEVI